MPPKRRRADAEAWPEHFQNIPAQVWHAIIARAPDVSFALSLSRYDSVHQFLRHHYPTAEAITDALDEAYHEFLRHLDRDTELRINTEDQEDVRNQPEIQALLWLTQYREEPLELRASNSYHNLRVYALPSAGNTLNVRIVDGSTERAQQLSWQPATVGDMFSDERQRKTHLPRRKYVPGCFRHPTEYVSVSLRDNQTWVQLSQLIQELRATNELFSTPGLDRLLVSYLSP